jgi:hypothetical protein
VSRRELGLAKVLFYFELGIACTTRIGEQRMSPFFCLFFN